MPNKNVPQSSAGFAGVPQVGFAAYEQGRTLGSYAPQVGFAAALRAAQEAERAAPDTDKIKTKVERSADEPGQHQPNKPSPSRQSARREEIIDDTAGRLTTTRIVVGRRVKSDRQQRRFGERLQAQRPDCDVVPAGEWTMQYLTDAEANELVNQVVERARWRPRTPHDERAIIRAFGRNFREVIGRHVRADLENEAIACELDPEGAKALLWRIQNPDRYEAEQNISARETDNIGIFTEASFVFGGLGSLGPRTKTIRLQDTTGVLEVGRQRIVAIAHDTFGLDISHISEEWGGPQVKIMHKRGDRGFAGDQYRMPEMPFLDLTLGPASAYEQ